MGKDQWAIQKRGRKKKELTDTVSVVELYSIIVGKGGISPSYFLDQMTWFEVDACLSGIEAKDRVSWEQTRALGYITAQSHSAKEIKYSDVMRFHWDKKKDTSNIQADINRLLDLKERVKIRVNELNNK